MWVPVNVPSSTGNIIDDVQAVDLDVRVGEGDRPAAIELGAGRRSLIAHPARRSEDDVVREHLGEPVEVVGVERLGPLLKSLAYGHRHQDPLP